MSTTPIEEKNYIEGIITGDSRLIREIYEQYSQPILRLIQTNSGSHEDARDVFQEGLMLVYQKAKQPDFQLTSSFFTYFYSICRFIWMNRLRKKSFSEVTLNDEITSTATELSTPEIEQNEKMVLYRKKFLLLGADCQKVLSLFLKKVSMKEIVEKMGYSSVSYAKKRKFKCKEQLIKLVASDSSYQELITP